MSMQNEKQETKNRVRLVVEEEFGREVVCMYKRSVKRKGCHTKVADKGEGWGRWVDTGKIKK